LSTLSSPYPRRRQSPGRNIYVLPFGDQARSTMRMVIFFGTIMVNEMMGRSLFRTLMMRPQLLNAAIPIP
jgi:hypothetical protein